MAWDRRYGGTGREVWWYEKYVWCGGMGQDRRCGGTGRKVWWDRTEGMVGRAARYGGTRQLVWRDRPVGMVRWDGRMVGSDRAGETRADKLHGFKSHGIECDK